MRFALLGEIPAPFRIPLFNALAERLDFLALFLARSDPRRPYYDLHADEWRFEGRVLPGRELTIGGRWVVLNRRVGRELSRFAPDVVGVGGWNQPASWQALAWCRARRRPLLVWVESTARDARSQAAPLELAKAAMIRAAAGLIVPGKASADYLRGLGVAADKIVVAPNAVDVSIFGQATRLRNGRQTCRFLYVGRLDPEKGLDTLVRALDAVPGELVLAGSGSDEARLRALASERVRFMGPLGRDELVPLYAEADVFVLPSRSEPWGMVLNEAAAAGLPLVATEGVGAAYDLIDDGVNGFRVPVDDADALARAMRRFSEDAAFRADAGRRSLELSRRFTPEAWADAVAGLVGRLA